VDTSSTSSSPSDELVEILIVVKEVSEEPLPFLSKRRDDDEFVVEFVVRKVVSSYRIVFAEALDVIDPQAPQLNNPRQIMPQQIRPRERNKVT
jgi:hypothetical protein